LAALARQLAPPLGRHHQQDRSSQRSCRRALWRATVSGQVHVCSNASDFSERELKPPGLQRNQQLA
jgi:hypothetical protein